MPYGCSSEKRLVLGKEYCILDTDVFSWDFDMVEWSSFFMLKFNEDSGFIFRLE